MADTKTAVNPTFSGNPEDLDSFVDMILKDMTLEQLAYYSVNKYAAEAVETASGYTLPKTALGGLDVLSGVDTDMPIPVHIGQTWNMDLAREVGNVIGTEYRGRFESTNPNTLAFAALADLRSNPLCGRSYEGFSEDTYFTGLMVDKTGNGFLGDDEFYIKTQMSTKHYSVYHCEWDRTQRVNYINHRTWKEYQYPAFRRAVKNGNVIGTMTAFGGMNGIPHAVSPYLAELQAEAPYSLFNLGDYDCDYELLRNLSNGYDEAYAKTPEEVAALLIKAGAFSSNETEDMVSRQNHIDAVNDGLLGVTREDLENQVRPQIELWVRSGYFNLDDYPYLDLCADYNPVTSASTDSQKVAEIAGAEGIVLLKNEGEILPLTREDKIMVTGMFADYRVQPGYTVATPDTISGGGVTPVKYLQEELGDQIIWAPEVTGDKLKFKAQANGKYLVANEDDTVTASADSADDATEFLMYDWGQLAYDFLDPATDKFIQPNAGSDATAVVMANRDPAATPNVLTYETTEDGKKYMRYGARLTNGGLRVPPRDEGIQFYHQYSQLGNFLTVDADSGLMGIGNASTDGYSTDDLFEVTTVARAGENISAYAEKCDCALVFVGSDSNVGASEFEDRCNMDLGENQIELVRKVTESFDRVIVVLHSVFPMSVSELQEMDGVSAIVYMSYAGEFDAKALYQVLFGEVTPSGHLTASWLKDLSTLPKISDTDQDEAVDPQYTVYMKNADMAQLKLTYQYQDADDVLYPFGYGLSYADFSYTDYQVQVPDAAGENPAVSVTVTNTSSTYSGKAVVQIYVTQQESQYGTYIPKKQLAAFTKTNILAPGESQNIALEVDLDAIKRWDVTANTYILESGSYRIWLGSDCEHEIAAATVELQGQKIGLLDLSQPANVFESCYACVNTRGSEVSKKRTTSFAGNYTAVESTHAEDFVILPNVQFGNASTVEISAASLNETSQISFHTGSPEGPLLSTITFSATEPVTYYLDDNQTIEVTELGFTDVTGTLNNIPEGSEDLYIVFAQPYIKLDSICLK